MQGPLPTHLACICIEIIKLPDACAGAVYVGHSYATMYIVMPQ